MPNVIEESGMAHFLNIKEIGLCLFHNMEELEYLSIYRVLFEGKNKNKSI